MATFIGSGIYRGSSYGAKHPLSIPRVPTVIDLSRSLGWLPSSHYRTSPKAKPEALLSFHTERYVTALIEAEHRGAVDEVTRERHGLGTLSNPVFPEMYRRPATAAGGGLLAAELVAQGGKVFNPGGGTHHGFPDRAAGFCYLNEPVVTIHRLLAMGMARVLYVDIDAHHSDGVEAAFSGIPDVRMVSIHEEARWPFTGKLEDTGGGSAFNLPVPKGFNDSEFLYCLEEVILPSLDTFRPDVVYLQCGADALLEDPLSRLALSNNAHIAALRALMPLAPRLIVSGGGGYNPWSVGRLWTRVWGELRGAPEVDHLPEGGREILRGLRWNRRGEPAPALIERLCDDPRPGPIRQTIRERVGFLRTRLRRPV